MFAGGDSGAVSSLGWAGSPAQWSVSGPSSCFLPSHSHGAGSESHPSASLSKEPSADHSWSSAWNRGLQYGKQIYMNSPSSLRPLKEIRDVWAAQLQFRCLRRAAFTMAWTPLLLMLLSHCTGGGIPQRHRAAPQSMLASLAQNLRQLNSGPCPSTHMCLCLQVPSPSLC